MTMAWKLSGFMNSDVQAGSRNLTNANKHSFPGATVAERERVAGDLEWPLLRRPDVVRRRPAFDLVRHQATSLVHGVRAEVPVVGRCQLRRRCVGGLALRDMDADLARRRVDDVPTRLDAVVVDWLARRVDVGDLDESPGPHQR